MSTKDLKPQGVNQPQPLPITTTQVSANQTGGAQAVQLSAHDPRLLRSQNVLQLQRLVGNAATVKRLGIQPKLTVGAAGDCYEQEADRLAEQVMSMPLPANQHPLPAKGQPAVQRREEDEIQAKPPAASITPRVQRTAAEEKVQASPDPMGSFEAGNAIEHRLATRHGSGVPLPTETRAFMEPRFGADFSGVRVHADREAAQINRALNAQAFTHGQDIYMGEGHYNPNTDTGKSLLAHELTHTIQQGGDAVQRHSTVTHFPHSEATLQRKIGFELELLTLVDVDGRPAPEKSFLGRYGAQNLELQVDQNSAVDSPTPTAAADANFQVAASLPTATRPIPPMHQYGAYDLPNGYETQVGISQGGAGVVDPRSALNFDLLHAANWQSSTAAAHFNRPPAVNDIGLDNTALRNIDIALPQYENYMKNWEADRAAQRALVIQTNAQAWLDANNNPPEGKLAWLTLKKYHYTSARALIQRLLTEVRQHRDFWTDPANQNPPAGLGRLYRRPGAPNSVWSPRHPVAGAGGSTYASILEIVTRPYDPETANGRADLIAAMTEASQLAGEIETRTGNFANRVPFNWAGVNLVTPNTFIGNPDAADRQSTAASIQSTFAVDLAQIGSLMKSTIGINQDKFHLKHQADHGTEEDHGNGARVDNAVWTRVAELEMARAVVDATNIIHDLKAAIGVGAPDFVNLRGLLILVCQYLRMGKQWKQEAGDHSLDKNLTDLLSRTDLSSIYTNLVSPAEKTWLNAAGANKELLYNRIFNYAGRTRGSLLLNVPTENLAPRGSAQFSITCDRFVRNVFTQPQDGVTNHWGGFQQRPAESVDPLGARPGAEANRLAPVFEMRNMIPKLGGTERFPRNTWVGLATYLANAMRLLNARTEAQATTDVRVNTNATATNPENHTW